MGFKRWNDAHTAAVTRARELVAGGLDPRDAEQGIEWNPLMKYFTVSGLPRRENRAGWELRCEVVKPGDPLTTAAASDASERMVAHATQGGCGHTCDDDCRANGCKYDGAPDGVF